MSSARVNFDVTKHTIDGLAGAINRMKTLSARYTPGQLQQSIGGLESLLKVLEGVCAKRHTEYERLAGVLESTKAELITPDAPTPAPASTDLDVLISMKYNVSTISRALREALKARNHHMDLTNVLTEELSQVRADLEKEQADHFAGMLEVARYKALVDNVHYLLWEQRIDIVNLTTRCDTAEAAVATMSDGPGYHQCKVCFAAESNAFFACGHLACCMACAAQLPAAHDGGDTVRCPMCRAEGEYRKVFFG